MPDVEIAVASVLTHAVQFIKPGPPIRIHAELLQRVREWKRQADIGHGVRVIAANQQVVDAVRLTSSNRDCCRSPVIFAPCHIAGGSNHGSAGDQHQLSGLSSV